MLMKVKDLLMLQETNFDEWWVLDVGLDKYLTHFEGETPHQLLNRPEVANRTVYGLNVFTEDGKLVCEVQVND